MNLQELPDLTGKILVERPELATIIPNVSTGYDSTDLEVIVTNCNPLEITLGDVYETAPHNLLTGDDVWKP